MHDVQAIITRDFAKNHQWRDYDEAHAQAVVKKYVEQGGAVIHAPNVLIFHAPKAGQGVEFHTMNGGAGVDLSQAVNAALHTFKKTYDYAVTYYDNPRVSVLMQYSDFPVNVTRTDAGLDRTYEARFLLKGP